MKKNIGPKPNKRKGWEAKKRRRESALERHEKSLSSYETLITDNPEPKYRKWLEKKVSAVKLVITRTRELLGKEAL